MDYRIFNDLKVAVMIIDLKKEKVLYISDMTAQIFEIDADCAETVADLINKRSVRQMISSAIANAQLSKGFTAEYDLTAECGKRKWVIVRGLMREDDGANMLYLSFVDTTMRKEIMEQLYREREHSRLILEITDDIIFDYDLVEKTVYFSGNFSQHFRTPNRLENFPNALSSYFRIIAETSISTFWELVERINNGDKYYSCEIELVKYDGEHVWYNVQYKLILDIMSTPIKAIGKMTDITRQKERMEELQARAETDSLTKLYNKIESKQRIERLLEKSIDERFALLIVDIDNFKGVNDNLGHQFGDAVLVDISAKIKSLFRDSDVVGRLGGDEFVVFLRNITNDDIVSEKANALCEAFRHTYSGKQNQYKISGSVGIAFSPEHGITFDELYHAADMALYQSKQRGKDCYTIYHERISSGTMEDIEPIRDAERFVASYFANDPIYNIFEMLYETKDIHTTINMILAIIGKRFNVDRCYIFEYTDDGLHTNNTYEWCANGVTREIENLQNIPIEQMDKALLKYNVDGVFYCNDLSTLSKYSYEILSSQGIKSLIHCAIVLNGKTKGFIGFDDCKDNRVWRGDEIATLSYISRILSIFLDKK